ncbi:MAG: coproporphyrinogen dehydrogenase HemZ [Provencibacterium sp.]|jgi:oxygen-independent coproporphyrinogen-3 oxidase|nr:coproporphyrinogen dehydrogenase HemZ [Provencibacterium sp.]
MKIFIDGHDFHYEMQALAMLFSQGRRVQVVREAPAALPEEALYTGLRAEGDGWRLLVRARLGGGYAQREETVPAGSPDAERRMGRLCYQALSELTGLRPAWGILTGVRPVKLVRAALEKGADRAEAERYFLEECLVSEEKLRLCCETAEVQRPLLARSRPEDVSLYISIPFCPSRCRYCSFVSHSIGQAGKLVEPYLQLLGEELRALGEKARRYGLRLTAVYFGGGTPTTLEAGQLDTLLETVAESFDLSAVQEYTVEAGRPDTITAEKLQALRRRGVDRISVNPQSLQDAVLEKAGRRHTAAQAVESYRLARTFGFQTINMDLIAGLEGDTPLLFADTLRQVIALRPENVTVHTLSVKRAANLSEDPAAVLARRGAEEMVSLARGLLTEAGYRPYYLYRQKNMLQNLENTGYSLPGHESAYNIRIMDESQTILAAGAGGVTKLVGGGEIQRIFNYKYPYEYISRFHQLRERQQGMDDFYKKFPIPGVVG